MSAMLSGSVQGVFAGFRRSLRNARVFSSQFDATNRRLCLTYNRFRIDPQDIFAGTDTLAPFLTHFSSLTAKRVLIVTDPGVLSVGVINTVLEGFKTAGFPEPTVYAKTKSDPSVHDVAGIVHAYLEGNCDSILALGGGGPMDAGKAAAAVVAAVRSNQARSADDLEFLPNIRKLFSGPAAAKQSWSAAVPPFAAIPTTSGTGSEAGKSAVICDLSGKKMVFGDIALMPKVVALVPQLTAGMPQGLTAATGVDALFHCMEALFVTDEEAKLDGCDAETTFRCNSFAMAGIELVLRNLTQAVSKGSDLRTRLDMQLASMYGAKAFRKGSLGGVHATAHALGAHYHIHHGTAIGRTSEAVLEYTQSRAYPATAALYNEVGERFATIAGIGGHTLAERVGSFLAQLGLPRGLSGLDAKETDLLKLTELAVSDPCQTNPVKLEAPDYSAIFARASQIK